MKVEQGKAERITEVRILDCCHNVAEDENMIWVCSGAVNVGEIAHKAGNLLTYMGKGRTCCTAAVATGSEAHVKIALKAKKNIVINGCGLRCASKILEHVGARIDYEIVLTNDIPMVLTFDVSDDDVKKVAEKIVEEAKL